MGDAPRSRSGAWGDAARMQTADAAPDVPAQTGAGSQTPGFVEHRLLTQKPVHSLSVWQVFTWQSWLVESQTKFVMHSLSVLHGVAMQWPAWHVSPAAQSDAVAVQAGPHTPLNGAPTQGVVAHTAPRPASAQSPSTMQPFASMVGAGPPHPEYTPPGAQMDSTVSGHWLADEHVEPAPVAHPPTAKASEISAKILLSCIGKSSGKRPAVRTG